MNKKKIKIGFIGAGSIGSLFGGNLANIQSEIYDVEVIFFCLKAHKEAINKNGLKIYSDDEFKVIRSIQAYEDEKIIEERLKKDLNFEFDFMFITTKAYDIEQAINQYKNLIDLSSWFVILQNGIGNEEIVSKDVLKSKMIRAVTTNGALMKGPGEIVHTGKGITKIGFPFLKEFNPYNNEIKKADKALDLLVTLLELASFETLKVEDIIKESWEKVFVNVGINAFGALTRLKNGQLLELEGLKHMMAEAIKEALRVARKKKINIVDKDYVKLTYDVAKNTSENKNSMLQDILNHQSTEIDFINGRVVKYANELGISVPINELLTNLVKGLEISFN
ncbi:MAG: ketopantoate reductase family protein [Candidatus Thorarchaeota archaeon]